MPDDDQITPENHIRLSDYPEFQRKIDPDDEPTRPEQISNLSQRPEFQQRLILVAPPNGIDASLPEHSEINKKEDVVNWMNKYYWKITLKGKVKYMSKRNPSEINFLDRKGLIEDTENLQLKITSAETDKVTFMPWSKIWLESLSRNELDKVIFHPDPKYVSRPRTYNFWQGYKLKPEAGDVAPFTNLMRDVICSGHDYNYKYLEVIVAQMFQEPHLKPSIAVAIRGDEGVGKSFFVERLCDLVAPYYFKTSNPAYVFGDHNSQLKDKTLLHLEEAVWPGGKKTESLFKDLISSPTLEINEKFQPVLSVVNHLHMFLTGNPDWIVNVGLHARRIFALHASDGHRKDFKYFGALYDWFHKEGGAQALLHYFLNYNIQAALDELKITDLRSAPVTDELIVQKGQSLTPVQEWWDSICESKEIPFGELMPDGKVRVIKKLLYLDYINSPMGKRYPLSDKKFAHQFLELVPLVVDGVEQKNDKGLVLSSVETNNVKITDSRDIRRDGYILPDAQTCRELFEFKLGGKKIWNTRIDVNDEDKGQWTVLRANNNFDCSLYKEGNGEYN